MVDSDGDGVADINATYLGLDQNGKPIIDFEPIQRASAQTDDRADDSVANAVFLMGMLIIVVLVVRPQGLLGQRIVEKV